MWSAGAQADPRLARIAAAISIGEKGVAEENAALLVAAAEMLDGARPSGLDMVTQYAEEARFFARGDTGSLQRLDALTFPAPDPQVTVQVFEAGDKLTSAVQIAAFVPPLPRSVCTAKSPDTVPVCNMFELKDFLLKQKTYAVFLMSDE